MNRTRTRLVSALAAVPLAAAVATASPAAAAVPETPAVPATASYYQLTFSQACYAYDANGGSKTLVGYQGGRFLVANDGSTATLADAVQDFRTRSWEQTSSRWNNASGSTWVNGYSGTYGTGSETPWWNPNAWFPWSNTYGRWGTWVVQGYATTRLGLKYRCTVVAVP